MASSNMGNSNDADTFQEMFPASLDINAGNDTIRRRRSLYGVYNIQEQPASSLGLTDNTDLSHLVPSPSTASVREDLSSPFNFDDQRSIIERKPPPPDPRLSLSFLPLAADEEKWDVSNGAFLRAMQSTMFIPTPDQVDPDVPFKAIFGGWHTVDAREREKPIWNMLRLIDERVFGMWTSRIQKVALMYVTHALVKVCS